MRGSTVISRMLGKQEVVTCLAVATESALVRADNRSSSDRKWSRGILSAGDLSVDNLVNGLSVDNLVNGLSVDNLVNGLSVKNLVFSLIFHVCV